MSRKIWIETVGCAKNQVDSEVLLGLLTSEGFEPARNPVHSDLIIVNTCGFIESAIEESIETILEMAKHKQSGTCSGLIVAGCLYQRYKDKLRKEMPEVDAFIGCGELKKIGEACRNVLEGNRFTAVGFPNYLYDHGTPRTLLNGPTSVYGKIAAGCDNRCSYCTIPSIRGRYRSRPLDSLVKEVRGLLDRGAKEINLIAQDTTYLGVPESGEEQLTHLLRELDIIRGKKWIRLMYAHPARITNAVARAIDDSRSVCHYLDMPIQHISDDILKAMRRKGTSDDIRRAIDTLRNEIPDVAIRTTLMVGFPGETDKHFKKLLTFAQKTRFDRLGVFKYSREPGTAAAHLPRQVPDDVKEERYEALTREQALIAHALSKPFVGRKLEALIESVDEEETNIAMGRTYRDAPEVDGVVRIPFKGSPPLGEFVQVKITEAHDYDLKGRLL